MFEQVLNIPIQIKRGSDSTIASYAGLEGELVYNRTNHSLYVMDGSTLGGFRIGNSAVSELTNDSGFITNTVDSDFTVNGNVDSQTLSTNTATVTNLTTDNQTITQKLTANEIAGQNITTNTVKASDVTTASVVASGPVSCDTIDVTSDERKKSNITRLEEYDLSSIKGYRYKLNDDEKIHIGLIAQEVEKIIPEAVNVRRDGTLSLDYMAIVAILIDKINKLEEKVNRLESVKIDT